MSLLQPDVLTGEEKGSLVSFLVSSVAVPGVAAGATRSDGLRRWLVEGQAIGEDGKDIALLTIHREWVAGR